MVNYAAQFINGTDAPNSNKHRSRRIGLGTSLTDYWYPKKRACFHVLLPDDDPDSSGEPTSISARTR